MEETICSICGGGSFKGVDNRPCRVCKECGAMERQRALWSLIKNELRDKRVVVEVGPLNKYVFGGLIKDTYGCGYVSVDRWRKGNPDDPRDVSFVSTYGDICSLSRVLPYRADVFLMQHVLKEVNAYKDALREVHAILNVGGVAYMGIVTRWSQKHEAIKDHPHGQVWHFSRKELLEDLNEIFSAVKTHDYTESNFSGTIYECRQ